MEYTMEDGEDDVLVMAAEAYSQEMKEEAMLCQALDEVEAAEDAILWQALDKVEVMDVQTVPQSQPPVNTAYDETSRATAFLEQLNKAAKTTKTRSVCETVSVVPAPQLIDDQETAAAAAFLQELNEAAEKSKTILPAAQQQAVYDAETTFVANFSQLAPTEPATSQLINEADTRYFQQQGTAPTVQVEDDQSMDWWEQPTKQELPPLPNMNMTPPLLHPSQPMSMSSQDQWGGEIQQVSQADSQQDSKASQSQPHDVVHATPAAPQVAQAVLPPPQQQAVPPAAPPPPQQQAAQPVAQAVPPAAPPPPQQQAALNNTARQVTLQPHNILDIVPALNELQQQIRDILVQHRQEHNGIKWHIAMNTRYVKIDENGERLTTEPLFRSEAVAAVNDQDIEEQLAEAMLAIHRQSQEFLAEGSGWSLDKILGLTIHTVAYQPLMGNSYIKTPAFIAAKKAVINVQNRDDKCILWSILAHLHPAQRDAQRVTKYQAYEQDVNMNGVSFPTPVQDIKKIEQNNSTLSINVFGYDKTDGIVPLYHTKAVKEQHISLLLIKEGEKSHYCLIKDFSKLMAHRTAYGHRMFYCSNCLHGFIREDLLTSHQELCYKQKAQKIEFPKEDVTIKFNNIQKQLRVPFVIYADFECFTEKIQGCVNNPGRSNTTKYQKHTPSGFSYVVISSNPKYSRPPVLYRGKDVVDKFLSCLMDEEQRIVPILKNPMPLKMTAREEQAFQDAHDCHICDKPLGTDRVRDHDHLSGNFRGAAHNKCNLAFKYQKVNEKLPESYVIPVVFHNLRGYDGHLLMKSVGKYKKRRLSVIPNNSERYISFTLGRLRFIDSFQFLGTSLGNLVTNLAADGADAFKQLAQYTPDPVKRELLLRKGVYPYDYVDSPAKLEERALPTKTEFYSVLNQEAISDADYHHAQKVWETFNCQTLGDYHDVYLKSDVLLLADVFESFRDTALATYKLDPAHYFTAPGFSWDSMLKFTEVELALLDDPDMYLMIESGIRGGVATITKKYAKANNPKQPTYDETKPTNYLMYWDANNLYGWAMSKKLPEKDFDWMTEEQLERFDVMQVPDDAETGYILEVDLEYPEELHDLHNDYPLAPQTMKVPHEDLSPYTQQLKNKLNVKGQPHKKLMPNLHKKEKYVIHYINLKQCLQLGMKLTRIHRGIEFRQSFWLAKYIALNTEKRKQARNTFEKDFFKLLNNSIFGKTMENVRQRVNFELVHTEKRLKKVAAKPSFHRAHIFNDDLTGVLCLKSKIKLDKPIYVGFAILDLSKTLMYDFHYNFVKAKYGDAAELCFTDTDSLLYDIHTDDVYADMQASAHMFDFSDYPQDNELHSNVNKKVLGKMKDELAGQVMDEFVGLRPKMYSVKHGGVEKKRAKGIKKSTVRDVLKHDAYVDVVFNEHVTQATMRRIQSKDHELFSVVCNKRALSPYDDKRYVLPNKFSTRAHGHYRNA